MTRAKDISKIVTDADLSGTLDVTGAVTAGGLTMDTGGNSTHTLEFGANRTSDSQALGIIRGSWNSTVVSQINLSAGDDTTNKDNGQIFFRTAEAGTTANRLRIEENGDISFYEDTGTTPKLFWDASAESLGIGTASPANALHVKGVTTVAYIESTGTNGDIQLDASGTTGYTAIRANNNDLAFLTNTAEAMRITSGGTTQIRTNNHLDINDANDDVSGRIRNVSSSSNSLAIEADPNSSAGGSVMNFKIDGSEHMRIDSNGHLLVGKTVSDNTTVGVNIEDNGFMSISRSNNIFMILNRTNDGDILRFTQSGSNVGNIRTNGGDITIGSSNTGLRFKDSVDEIQPQEVVAGAGRDNAIDLT